MPVKKKPSAAQLAARAKFVKMVRAKAAAKKASAKKIIRKPSKIDDLLLLDEIKGRAKKVAGLDKVTRKGKKTTVSYSRVSGVKPRPTVVKLAKLIASDTDNNQHTKAVVRLATFLKNKDALQMLRAIDSAHNKYGHLPEQFINARNFYLKECLQLAKLKLNGVDYDLIKSAY
jgi:hypothetical protein